MSQNPYATPVKPSNEAPHHNQSSYVYKPLGTLAKVLLISVSLVCLANLSVSAMETFGEFLFPGFSDPNAMLSGEAEEYFLYAMIGVGLLIVPVFILSGVLTAILFYRANANLWSFGVRGLEHTPGWCAGYWFIPIVSLFKPYVVAGEISEHCPPKGFQDPTPAIGLWWACWIIGNVLSNVESRLALSGVNLGTGGLVLSWAATLTTCAAGYLFIRMIFSFAKSQEAMAKEVY